MPRKRTAIKSAIGVDVERAADLDERQLARWIVQASRFPGLGAGRK